MKPNAVKKALFDTIQAMNDYKWFSSARPGKENTRNRKFPFRKMNASILAFRGGTLNREITGFYGLEPSVGTASDISKALLYADRGYESYNNLAHIQEKGRSFLIFIKDSATGIASGLMLPYKNEFDIPFRLKLTRKQTNSVKELLKDKNHYKFIPSTSRFDFLPLKSPDFYDLYFRIVRSPISDTGFRQLKHTLCLLHLHAKRWNSFTMKSLQNLLCTTSAN